MPVRRAVSLVLALSLAAPVAAASWLADQARMDRFHGVLVQSVAGGGRVVHAYGHADLAGRTANGARVVYPLGSIGKPLTALTIMQLVEQGRLQLEAPLDTYLQVAAGTPAGAVTLEQLLSHSAGVPSIMQSGQGLPFVPVLAALDQPMDRKALLAEFIDAPLLFEPGSRYRYSNSGYVLLALVIEAVDGRTWSEAVRERVLNRAGVVDACVCARLPGRIHAQAIEGFGAAAAPAVLLHPDRALGAGALISTPLAMLDLIDAVLAGRVVDRASLEQMWRPRVPTGRDDHHYGLGWEIVHHQGRRLIAHAGGVPGAVANLMFEPDSGIAVIGVANRTFPLMQIGFSQNYVIQLTGTVLTRSLGLESGWQPPELATSFDAAALVGHWRLDDGTQFSVDPGAHGSLNALSGPGASVLNLRQNHRLHGAEAEATEERIRAWARGDLAAFRAAMSAQVAAHLDPASLDGLFRGLETEFGTWQDAWVFAIAQGVHRVRLRFADGAVDLAVIHDDAGVIEGLRMLGNERGTPPREARLWPLAGGRLLLDRFALRQADEVWDVQFEADGRHRLVIDVEASLQAVRDVTPVRE